MGRSLSLIHKAKMLRNSSAVIKAQKALKASKERQQIVAAGLAILAEDTGRVLMLQRGLSEDDEKNGGKWEFPGGHIEEGENPRQGAEREWAEEVGLKPPSGEDKGEWKGGNGKYVGFVVAVPSEDVLDLKSRDEVKNPDGDNFEAAAWVHPDDMQNHNLRSELVNDLQRVRRAIGIVKSLIPNYGMKVFQIGSMSPGHGLQNQPLPVGKPVKAPSGQPKPAIRQPLPNVRPKVGVPVSQPSGTVKPAIRQATPATEADLKRSQSQQGARRKREAFRRIGSAPKGPQKENQVRNEIFREAVAAAGPKPLKAKSKAMAVMEPPPRETRVQRREAAPRQTQIRQPAPEPAPKPRPQPNAAETTPQAAQQPVEKIQAEPEQAPRPKATQVRRGDGPRRTEFDLDAQMPAEELDAQQRRLKKRTQVRPAPRTRMRTEDGPYDVPEGTPSRRETQERTLNATQDREDEQRAAIRRARQGEETPRRRRKLTPEEIADARRRDKVEREPTEQLQDIEDAELWAQQEEAARRLRSPAEDIEQTEFDSEAELQRSAERADEYENQRFENAEGQGFETLGRHPERRNMVRIRRTGTPEREARDFTYWPETMVARAIEQHRSRQSAQPEQQRPRRIPTQEEYASTGPLEEPIRGRTPGGNELSTYGRRSPNGEVEVYLNGDESVPYYWDEDVVNRVLGSTDYWAGVSGSSEQQPPLTARGLMGLEEEQTPTPQVRQNNQTGGYFVDHDGRWLNFGQGEEGRTRAREFANRLQEGDNQTQRIWQRESLQPTRLERDTFERGQRGASEPQRSIRVGQDDDGSYFVERDGQRLRFEDEAIAVDFADMLEDGIDEAEEKWVFLSYRPGRREASSEGMEDEEEEAPKVIRTPHGAYGVVYDDQVMHFETEEEANSLAASLDNGSSVAARVFQDHSRPYKPPVDQRAGEGAVVHGSILEESLPASDPDSWTPTRYGLMRQAGGYTFYVRSGDQSRIPKMEDFFGNAPLKTVGELTGLAPDPQMKIHIEISYSEMEINVEHPMVEGLMQRTLYNNRGEKHIHNDFFILKKEFRKGGLGAQIFGRQVDTAVSLGFAYMDVYAAGDYRTAQRGGMNGYYTWPRLGYNIDIDELSEAEEIREEFPGVETIQDLFEEEGGAEWWRINGSGIDGAVFDLSEGSTSRYVLSEYLRERARRNQTGQKSLDLSDQDDAILDDVWKSLSQGKRQPDVPFQGPSGRWFVYRSSDKKVVPAPAPGGDQSPVGQQAPQAQPQQQIDPRAEEEKVSADPQFAADWAKTVEENYTANYPYSVQEVAQEQDWHNQLIEWRTAGGEPAPDTSGVAARFIGSLINPLMGGVNYIDGLARKHAIPLQDSPLARELLADLDRVNPQGQANGLIAAIIGWLFGEPARDALKQLPTHPDASQGASQPSPELSQTPQQPLPSSKDAIVADIAQRYGEEKANDPVFVGKIMDIRRRINVAKKRASAKQLRLDKMTPEERAYAAQQAAQKLAQKKQGQARRGAAWWRNQVRKGVFSVDDLLRDRRLMQDYPDIYEWAVQRKIEGKSLGSLQDDPDFEALIDHELGNAGSSIATGLRGRLGPRHGFNADGVHAHADIRAEARRPKPRRMVRVSNSSFLRRKELIPGGLCRNCHAEDFDPQQLKMGIKVELEHTSDPAIAKEIAMDHLTEDAHYYSKLRKMEAKPKDLSWLAAGRGAELIGKRKFLPFTFFNKAVFGYLGKSKGEPCKQGETSTNTGCTPQSGDTKPGKGGADQPSVQPQKKYKQTKGQAAALKVIGDKPKSAMAIKKEAGLASIYIHLNAMVAAGLIQKVKGGYVLVKGKEEFEQGFDPTLEEYEQDQKKAAIGPKFGQGEVVSMDGLKGTILSVDGGDNNWYTVAFEDGTSGSVMEHELQPVEEQSDLEQNLDEEDQIHSISEGETEEEEEPFEKLGTTAYEAVHSLFVKKAVESEDGDWIYNGKKYQTSASLIAAAIADGVVIESEDGYYQTTNSPPPPQPEPQKPKVAYDANDSLAALKKAGVKPTTAAGKGYQVLSDEPISMEELMQKAGLKNSVYNAMKGLSKKGLVELVKVGGKVKFKKASGGEKPITLEPASKIEKTYAKDGDNFADKVKSASPSGSFTDGFDILKAKGVAGYDVAKGYWFDATAPEFSGKPEEKLKPLPQVIAEPYDTFVELQSLGLVKKDGLSYSYKGQKYKYLQQVFDKLKADGILDWNQDGYTITPPDVEVISEANAELSDLESNLDEPLPEPGGFPDYDPSSLKVIKELGGSTGAQLVQAANGKKFVKKKGGPQFGTAKEHITEETMADNAYRAMGVLVPAAKLYNTPSGPVKLAEYLDGAVTLKDYLAKATPAQKESIKKELQKNYVLDALFGNWDVVGMNYDNVMIGKDGKVWRIDNGGSFRYRAQGKLKTNNQWNDEVTEIETMKDGFKNPTAKDIFGNIGDAEIKKQVQDIVKKKDKLLKAIPNKDVRDKIAARIKWMDDYYGGVDKPVESITGSIYSGKGKDWPSKPPVPGNSYVAPKEELSNPLLKEWDWMKGEKAPVVHSPNYPESFKKHMMDAIAKLTPAEKAAAKHWTSSAYIPWGEAMRKCPETLDCLSADQKKNTENAEKAFAKAGKFTTPVNLYRKFPVKNLKNFEKAIAYAASTGEEIRFPGLKSTSVHPDKWSGNVHLKIRAKSGLWVEPFSHVPGEMEVLQGHNVRYVVKGYKKITQDYGGQALEVYLEEV